MFEYLEGTLVWRKPVRTVLDVGGIGYELTIPLSTYSRLPERGARCKLLVHFQVREDAHKLFGFATSAERELFRSLIGVAGIGPSIAIQILSGVSIDRFYEAIESGDEGFLTRIRGIGKKTAPRLIVELSGKLPERRHEPKARADGDVPVEPDELAVVEARAALESLGFKPELAGRAVERALARLGGRGDSTEALLREALRQA